jgi:hypothetical protein
MMKFMMMIKANDEYERGAPPDPRLVAAMGKLMEEHTKRGVLLEAGGLLPSAKGARVSLSRGKLTVTDGPFAEAKELIGGYAIVQLKSKKEAVAMARDFLKLHEEILGPSYTGECEVRQMSED